MDYQDDDSVRAHMMALAAFRALESLPEPKIKCGDCPYDQRLCGKGCPGEPEEPPDVSDVPACQETEDLASNAVVHGR